MHRIDHAMSPHRPDSELSRLNRDAAAGPVPLSDEMFPPARRRAAFLRTLRRRFDISYAAVGRLYDYRAGVGPDAAALEAARAVGWRQHLEPDAARARQASRSRHAHRPRRLRQGPRGGQRDRAAAPARHRPCLRRRPATAASSATAAAPWTIAVRDPRRPGEVVAVLPLEDTAISTSGDYERYFERDGVRCHHIVDPATGRSPDAVRSVTVLAADG